jgi:hypothetical protein
VLKGDAIEDLEKARQYLDFELERLRESDQAQRTTLTDR